MTDTTNIREKLENYCVAHGIAVPLYTDFDTCIVGVDDSDPESVVAVYSEEKILQYLTDLFDGDYDEALEWYHYNVIGAKIKNNPIVIKTLDDW